MNSIAKNKFIFSVIILVVITSFAALWIAQCYKIVGKKDSLLIKDKTQYSVTVLVVNRLLTGINSGKTSKTFPGSTKSSENRKSNKVHKYLLMCIGIVIMYLEKNYRVAAEILWYVKRNILKIFKKNTGIIENFVFKLKKFYFRCLLKFVTPVQKCIDNLVDKYDEKPVFVSGILQYVLKNPHFIR